MTEDQGGLAIMLTVVTCMLAWVTHVIHCLIHAKYLLLIAGSLIFPVGMIHGLGIWFGVSW